MRRAPLHATAHLCPDYIVCYICFIFIKSRQLIDETLIKIKIQFIQNEIHFKERLSTKQNLMKWSKSCLTQSMSLDISRILSYTCCSLFIINIDKKKQQHYNILTNMKLNLFRPIYLFIKFII